MKLCIENMTATRPAVFNFVGTQISRGGGMFSIIFKKRIRDVAGCCRITCKTSEGNST